MRSGGEKEALLLSKGKNQNLGQSVEDIAEIVFLSSPSECGGARELKAEIHRYISKLRKPIRALIY